MPHGKDERLVEFSFFSWYEDMRHHVPFGFIFAGSRCALVYVAFPLHLPFVPLAMMQRGAPPLRFPRMEYGSRPQGHGQ